MALVRHQLSVARRGLRALVLAALSCSCTVSEETCTGQRDACDEAAAAVDELRALGVEPLEGGLASLEEIGRAAVRGLTRGDEASLRALLVTTRDYTERLFPLLANDPAAHDMGSALLWEMQRRESLDDLGHAVERYRGQEMAFVAIEAVQVERRPGLTLHRSPTLVVRVGGIERRLRVLATVLEHEASGTFKLLAFRMRGEEGGA